jgi:hypothetical protein
MVTIWARTTSCRPISASGARGEQVAASLPVKVDTSAAIVGFQLNFNTLAKAAIMGLYKR